MATSSARLFASLSRSASSRYAKSAAPPAWWALPALRPFGTVAAVLAAASAPATPASRRPVLSALLSLAPTDKVAAEVLLAALVPALRSVAAELSRWAPVDTDEVDALVAAGAWEAVVSLGGRRHPWADRAIVCRARDYARGRLRAESRRRGREVLAAVDRRSESDTGIAEIFAWDLLERAVARGRLRPGAARLVWAARVEGRAPAELAALAGTSVEAASMARLRSERVLRKAVA